jgi:hypothetical protein
MNCLKNLTLILAFLFTLFLNGTPAVNSLNSTESKKISVTDFGAKPDDGQNDAESLRKAMDYCRTHPGTLLFFPPGTYDFRDEKAVQLMEDVMTGKMGQDPEKTIFVPYYPYVKGLDFSGMKNITVEADGALLLCDGWMEPVSLSDCSNITIKGLTIDYKREPYSIGKIYKAEADYFEAEFDSRYPVNSKMPIPRMKFWDIKANRMFPNPIYFPKKFEIISGQKVRIYSKTAPGVEGNIVMIPHSFHFRPAVLILNAKETNLVNVTIHSQPGMGIVGHRSHNITLNGLRIVPSPGSVQSTNTDATHFTSCTGLIRFKECQFEGQGDDATNIHNYYYTIQKPASGSGYDLLVKAGTFTHAQVLDYPDPGDKLELVDKQTLAVVKTMLVKSRVNDIKNLLTHVTLNEELPKDIENYFLINATRLPRVEITGCSILSHLARGILIKTRKVLIEHCLIRETTGTGIHVGAESWWHEGLPSADVVIRYNRIIRCGSGAGSQDGACGITVKVEAPNEKVAGLHKRLLIEGNIIEGENSNRGISISGADEVTVRNNEISGCKTPVHVQYSTNVKVYNNRQVLAEESK